MGDTIRTHTVSWREGDSDRDPECQHEKLAEQFWAEVQKLADDPRFAEIHILT